MDSGELSWKKSSEDPLSVRLKEGGSDESTIGPLEVCQVSLTCQSPALLQNATSSLAGPRIFASQEDQTDLLLSTVPEAPTPKICCKKFPKGISRETAKIVTKLFRNKT